MKTSARLTGKALLIQALIVSTSLILGSCGKLLPFGTCTAEQNTWVTNQQLPINDNTTYKQLAQTFIAGDNESISTIQAYLFKIGNPGDSNTLTATIYTNSTSNQPGTQVSSGSVLLSQVSATGSFVSITVSSFSLVQGATYWIVLTGNYGGATASNNVIQWARTNSGFSSGSASTQAYYVNYIGGATYQVTGSNQEFAFRVGSCSS